MHEPSLQISNDGSAQLNSNRSQGSKDSGSPWKLRKGAIPKIPGLRGKGFKKSNQSNGLD